MPDQVDESVKTDRLHRLEAMADAMKAARLREMIAADESLTVLPETVSGGYLMGHTESFVECGIELVDGVCGERLKGCFLTVTPVREEQGILICQMRKNT